jgi:hypothetical protein
MGYGNQSRSNARQHLKRPQVPFIKDGSELPERLSGASFEG